MKDDDGSTTPAEAWVARSKGMISYEEFRQYVAQNDPTYDPGGDPYRPRGGGGGGGGGSKGGGIGCVIVGLAMIGAVTAGTHGVVSAIEGPAGSGEKPVVDTRGGGHPSALRSSVTGRPLPPSLAPRRTAPAPAEIDPPGR
jgi:hypothetical protein